MQYTIAMVAAGDNEQSTLITNTIGRHHHQAMFPAVQPKYIAVRLRTARVQFSMEDENPPQTSVYCCAIYEIMYKLDKPKVVADSLNIF